MSYARTSDIAPIQVLSDQLRLMLRSADSPSQMSAMVVEVPPGGFVPPHTHGKEEEGYFVLEGELALNIADQTRTLAAGDFGHVPPRTVHGYANPGTVPVRFLAWIVGGADRPVLRSNEPACEADAARRGCHGGNHRSLRRSDGWHTELEIIASSLARQAALGSNRDSQRSSARP